jgi:tRNA threonylcarbamoyladenosine biosynthesis protein TsaE
MFPIQYSLASINDIALQLVQYMQAKQLNCITLQGNLGAGKTTLVKAMCAAMGIYEGVNSPTYTIINEYEGNGKTVFHLDLYRLTHASAFIETGAEDLLFSDAFCFIEWPLIAQHMLPQNRLDITITITSTEHRSIDLFEMV